MKLYTLKEIAHALPYDCKYELFLADVEFDDICRNMTWIDMYQILSNDWWSRNTELDSIVKFDDAIGIFLRKGDNA